MAEPALEAHPQIEVASEGWGALLRPRYLGPTVTLSLGVALSAFSTFFVATALPSAIGELGGAALISWATTLYLVFIIVGGLTAANLKRRFGARRALILAALLFAAGTVLTFLAPDMPVLLAGRVLQGAGEGVVAAICYALIPELFPAALVAKVFGVEAMVWAIAAFGGPLLAGALTEHLSWRAAFGFNLPAAIVFICLTLVAVPRGGASPEGADPVPLGRLVLAGGGILIACAASVVPPAPAALLLALAAGLILSAWRRDAASRRPILPAGAFRLSTPLGAGLWIILLMPLAESAAAVFVVYGLQNIWGLGPTAAGASHAALAVSWSLVAIAVANVRRPENRLKAIAAGPVFLALGMAASTLGFMRGEIALVIAGQVAMGCGFGLNWGPLCQFLMDVSPDGERDRTSAMLPTLQSAGFAIGAAIFGLAANLSGFGEGVAAETLRFALAVTFACAALVAALSAILGFVTAGKARRDVRDPMHRAIDASESHEM